MPIKQSVPIMERIKALRNPCGVGCSLCCALYSTWGVLMLLVIGVLTRSEYRGIDGDIPSIADHTKASNSCFYAALIYALFIVISVARLIQLRIIKARNAKSGNIDEYSQ